MAKIIENVESTIFEIGKKILLEEGYSKMTLRSVASKANIATGTIYNYFPSKDVLVARIMWGDWNSLINKTKPRLSECKTSLEGIEILFMMLKEYSSIYSKAWLEYGGTIVTQGERHHLLVKQLSEMIAGLLDNDMNNLGVFISEIILNAGSRSDISFKDIKPFIEKLLN